MTQLLEIRALLIGLYKKFDRIINPLIKFIVSLIIIIKVNRFFGYSPDLANLGINLAMAGLAAFLPSSWFLLIIMAVVALQLFEASLNAALIVFIAMLVVYLLFARIQPKYAMLIMLVPWFFTMNLAYVLPIFAGLFLGISSIIPLAVGIGVYFFAAYLPGLLELHTANATLFESPDILINMYKYLVSAMLADRNLMLTIAVFSGVVIVMFFVRKIEINYIWYITIGVGAIAMIVMFVMGNVALSANVSIGSVFIGAILGAIIVAAMQFFKFSLDYSKAEKLQFEDDEYYYYVRSIPKVKGAASKAEAKGTQIANEIKQND